MYYVRIQVHRYIGTREHKNTDIQNRQNHLGKAERTHLRISTLRYTIFHSTLYDLRYALPCAMRDARCAIRFYALRFLADSSTIYAIFLNVHVFRTLMMLYIASTATV
jgi:hypothetical protein